MRLVSQADAEGRGEDAAATARDRLVLSHLALARHLAARFANRGESREDLDQVAFLGLVKASHRFDPEFGASFGTYAADTIIGELRRHLRDRRWALHAPRALRSLAQEVSVVASSLTQELGRPPTIREIARACDRQPADVLAALEVGQTTWHSLVGDDEGAAIAEGAVLGDEAAVSSLDARDELWSRLAGLTDVERRLLQLRFGDELSQSEIARRLGTSQVQVSRELHRVLQTLRMAYRANP